MTYPDTGGGGGKIEPDECMHWKFPGAVCKHDKKGADVSGDACECGPECQTVEGCVDVDHGCNPSSECDAGTCDCADCQCEGPCDCGTAKEETIPQSAFSFRGPETIDMTSMSDKATRLIQVGGEHYVKYAIQPFDIIDCYGLSFYEGSALKYLLRHRDKNGVEDLKKARHYLDVLIAKAEVSNDAD